VSRTPCRNAVKKTERSAGDPELLRNPITGVAGSEMPIKQGFHEDRSAGCSTEQPDDFWTVNVDAQPDPCPEPQRRLPVRSSGLSNWLADSSIKAIVVNASQ